MKIFKTKKYSVLSNILKYSFVAIFAVSLLMPVLFVNNVESAEGEGTKIVTTIKNPLGENGPQNLPDFIKKVIEIVLIVGVPIIVLALIYTGFLFVKAQGNPEEITKAKNNLLYVIIGGALLLGAFVIAQAIGETVDDIKKGA